MIVKSLTIVFFKKNWSKVSISSACSESIKGGVSKPSHSRDNNPQEQEAQQNYK